MGLIGSSPALRSLAIGALTTLLSLGATVATAQEAADAAEGDAVAPQPVARARVLDERARDLYEAGDFERSVVLLEEALELHDAPELHYNLARALQELGRWADARREYAIYRERAPNTAVRERVDARIELLDRRIAEAEAEAEAEAAQTVLPPTEEPATPEPSFEPAPWVLLGVGAAIAAAGIPFAVLFAEADAAAMSAPTHADAYGPHQEAVTYAIVADVSFGVGAVTGLVGLIWGLVTLSASE